MRVCKTNGETIATERNPYGFSTAEAEEIKGEREAEEVKRVRARRDLKAVLKTVEGRAVLWQILCDTGLYRSSFSSDSHVMAFNEGQRNIGLMLIDRIVTADTEAYKLMQEEANDRRSRVPGSGK